MYIFLDIIVIAIVVLFAILGAVKGFAKTFIEVVGYILAFMIAFSVAGYTADYVYENKIKETIVSSVSEVANESVSGAEESVAQTVDKIWESLPSFVTAFSGTTGFNKESLTEYVENSAAKTNSGVEQLAVSVSENIVKPIAVSAIHLTVTVILIIVLLFIVKILAKLIGNLFKKSVFKGVNGFLGSITGAAKGILICFVLATLISIILPMVNNELYFITPSEIEKTYLFKWIFNIVKGF